MDAPVIRRRVLLAARSAIVISSIAVLSGCYMSDEKQDRVTHELMNAASGAPEYRSGFVQYFEGFSQGRYISGEFSFEAADEAEISACLDAALSRMAAVAAHYSLTDDAFVKVRGYSTAEDVNLRVEARDIVVGDPHTSVRMSEFLTHYGY